ncbi:MAG: hypothetical protein WB608_12955 [Terracidiphilus sp.]
MNKQNDAQDTAEASTDAPARVGSIRRFFNAWRRWERLMDYSPYDYTLDRIGQLESRVMELERAGNATNRLGSATGDMTQIGITRDANNAGI